MIKQKTFSRLLMLLALLLLSKNSFSQDPNFHIYLCFGQSNMEGQGTIEAQDNTVDSRFQVLQPLDCSNLSRSKATWYTAVPPLCQCYSGLSPADYFGRAMVANLPEDIKVGVVSVAVGGCDIRLFDKDLYLDYDDTYTEDWFVNKVRDYGGNPYEHLINLAKIAQQDGVIKGVLLHQGETNTGDNQWPDYVKKIYDDMMLDLSLDPATTPLIAGEVVHEDQEGACASMNSIIAKLSEKVPTAHVVSSSGCSDKTDNVHFNSEGYRRLGKRYAVKMLSLMGYETSYCEPECGTVGDNWRIMEDAYASNESYITATPELENLTEAPSDNLSVAKMSFNVSTDGDYYVYGRFKNLSTDDDSYWIKVDNDDYELLNDLTTTTWQWLELKSLPLTAGEHSISIAFAEDGGFFDKLAIKNSPILPVDLGEEADNLCEPKIYVASNAKENKLAGYTLEQNYPNPAGGSTSITFEIPKPTYVSLKVYDMKGTEVMKLVGKEFNSGKHKVELDIYKLKAGKYFYTIKAGEYSATKKMIVADK